MNIRTILAILFAILAPGISCLGASANIAPSSNATVFPDWKMSAEIPKPFNRHPLPASDDVPYSEVFISGDYAYTVEIVRIPERVLASTFIEQGIQSDIKLAPSDVKRWELQSRQGELFKGITKPYQLTTPYPGALQTLLGGETGIQSIAMAPLESIASSILKIGIISTVANKGVAENKAKALATFVVFTGRVKAAQGAPAPKPVTVAKKPVGVVTPNPAPGKTRVTVPPSVRPSPMPIPKPTVKPTPKPAHKPQPLAITSLRRGEIEILGVVESIDEAKKSLVMVVSQIRLPNGKMQKRDPAAPKIVRLRAIPAGIKPGLKISIIGRNFGVGKPILADVISLVGTN